AYDQNGAQMSANNISWSTNPTTVATVYAPSAGSQGVISGVAVGMAQVTASAAGVSGTASLNVSWASPPGLPNLAGWWGLQWADVNRGLHSLSASLFPGNENPSTPSANYYGVALCCPSPLSQLSLVSPSTFLGGSDLKGTTFDYTLPTSTNNQYYSFANGAVIQSQPLTLRGTLTCINISPCNVQGMSWQATQFPVADITGNYSGTLDFVYNPGNGMTTTTTSNVTMIMTQSPRDST